MSRRPVKNPSAAVSAKSAVSARKKHRPSLKPKDVSVKFGIPLKVLRYLISVDEISHYRVGEKIILLDERDVVAYLEKSRHEAA